MRLTTLEAREIIRSVIGPSVAKWYTNPLVDPSGQKRDVTASVRLWHDTDSTDSADVAALTIAAEDLRNHDVAAHVTVSRRTMHLHIVAWMA